MVRGRGARARARGTTTRACAWWVTSALLLSHRPSGMLAAWVRVKRGVSQHRFIFAYTSHLWVLCFVGAAIIQRVDGLSYLHSLFLATSAVLALSCAPGARCDTTPSPVTVLFLNVIAGDVHRAVRGADERPVHRLVRDAHCFDGSRWHSRPASPATVSAHSHPHFDLYNIVPS